MASGYGALCTDFFVNQKISLKMDLPSDRETILGLFDRLRKERPRMDQLHRYDNELALESPEDDSTYEWVALRRTSIRSGVVNPESIESACRLHSTIGRVAPFFLSISGLDVESLEIMFGFDFEVEANRNDLVFDALMGDSLLAGVIDRERERLIDCQPLLTFSLEDEPDIHATIDVKTRTRTTEVRSGRFENAPITVCCAMRRLGPFNSIDDLPAVVGVLAGRLEQLVDERIASRLLTPIREIILSRPG